MTPPTTITFEPEVITARPPQRRRREPVPAATPALTNRAAGRLRAEAAEAEPEDVGFAETRYERTAQDETDVVAEKAAVERAAAAAAPGAAGPAEPTPDAGPYRGPAAPEDTGLAGTRYERTAQDEADVATEVTAQAATGTTPEPAEPVDATAGRYTGVEPPNVAFAAPPIGAITTPAEMVSAARAAAAALPQAQLALNQLDAPLGTVVGAERARTGAKQARHFGGGGRMPPPRPLDPVEIDPVPDATKKIVEAVNARLPDLELPAPRPMPDGTVPTVKRPEGIDAQELAAELPVDDTPAKVDAKKAGEQTKRKNAIAAGKQAEPPQEVPPVPIDPPVLVDFRRPPAPVPSVSQDLADKANVAQALARILADTPAEAKKVVWAARDAAFPPNRMADLFIEVTQPYQAEVEKALGTEMDKLRDAVGLSTEELTAAVAARRTDLERIKAGQAAQSEAVATAASRELSEEAKKQQAKDEAERQRAQRQLVRRLQAALHSSDPKLVTELVDQRMTVIDNDVSTGVVAINQAADRRLKLIKAYEDAYREAYRAADDAFQTKMGAAAFSIFGVRPHAVNEDGKVWYDVAVDEIHATMKTKTEATTSTRDELVKNLKDAGTSARDAVRTWGDKRTRAKLTADEQQARAAQDQQRQQTAIDNAVAAAAKADTRSHLLNQVRLVAAVYDQDARKAAGQVIDEAHRLDDETMQVGRQILKAGDPKDPMSAVAAGIRAGFTQDQVVALAPQIQDKILRIEPTPENVADLAAVTFPEGTAGLDMRVDKLWTAFEGAGTDEDKVYEALGGLDWNQERLLGVRYEARHSESLAWRIDDEMSGDEYDRAIGLYLADKVRTAKAVISQSEGFFSNNKQMALDAIAALPPDQAAQVAADPEVKARLGRVLGDWRATADGRYVPDDRAKLQLNLILELKKITPAVAETKPGQPPIPVELSPQQRDLQARIDAIELDRAIRGHGEPNLDDMQKVYDRMRDTLKADPRTAAWSAEEFENELRRRTRAMENAYEKEFGPELPKGGVSALRTALAQRLVGGEKLDIAVAQIDVDRAGELAGRLQLSTRGLWASDSDVNKAMGANYERAYAEVQRSAACQATVEKTYQQLLKDHVAAGHKPSPEEQAAYRKEANETVAMDLAKTWFQDVNKRFGGRYGDQWGGNAATALKDMLIDTTQFNGEKEALARYENGGGLTVAEQVRFGVAGWGMDRDQVVGAIGGRTKEQLERIGAEYEKKYDENMVTRLKDESGGWDDSRENGPMERDAFDVREALRGVPTTSEETLAAAKRRFEYERDTYFKGNPQEREYAVGGQLATMQEAMNRTERAHQRLETARQSGDQDLIERTEAGFRNEQAGTLATADAYRKAVDDYVEGKVKIIAIVAAVVAGIVVEVVSGGTATPALVALISSLAGTAASMATKASILGAAYGKQQITNDLIVGAVDAVTSVLTARLGDVLLGLPKATGTAANEIRASLQKIAAQRAAKPFIARAAASLAQNFAQGAPTAMAAALLDRNTWKGDAGATVLMAGLTAGATNIAVGGVIHGVTNVVGSAVRGLRGALSRNAAAEIAAESVVLRSTREAVGEAQAHGPTGDRLAHLGTPTERLAAQREYLARFPDKTPEDFHAALERGTATVEANAQRVRELQREMTRELLSGIPAKERGLHADTPIIVLSDAEFTARTGSESRGQAATLVVNGEPVVVMREGAPLSALREEGIHVRQIRDSANAAKVALIDEARLAKWADASLEERIAGWNAKLDLEIEAQQKMIAGLETELRRPGIDPEARASMAERLEDARAAHETLSQRRTELAALDEPTRALIKEGKLDPPGYLAEQPRLFSKKIDPKALESTRDPLAKFGPVEKDPDTGKDIRWRYTFDKDGNLLFAETFEWDGERAVRIGPEQIEAGGKRRYRWYDTAEGSTSIVGRSEQRYSARRGIWVRSGSASRWGGGVAEMAAKLETAAKMGVGADGVKRVQFDGQTERGHGFDDVVFSFTTSKKGDVTARVGVAEIKDYPGGPVTSFTAIDRNFKKNLDRVRARVQALVAAGTWADAGMSEAEARAVLAAIDARRVDVEVRTTAGTRLSGDPLPGLQEKLRNRFGDEITVAQGKDHISDAALAEADIWFDTLERYRLGGPLKTTPDELTQFTTIARRHSGYTPDSIAAAEAVLVASRNPEAGIKGTVTWAPGGAHLVDDAGPLILMQPSRGTGSTFDPKAAARSILDVANTPLPGRAGKPVGGKLPNAPRTEPRVIVDYGALSSGEAQALADALKAEAKKRRQVPVLSRLIPVDDRGAHSRVKGKP